MRALKLDYQRRNRPGKALGFLVLALAIIAVFAVGETFVSLSAEKQAAEEALARVDKKRKPAAREPNEGDRRRIAADAKVADDIAERLTLPWSELFQALEGSSSPNVALLALEPDVPKRILRITAEARSKTDMLDYVLRLNNDQRLMDVHLMDHQLQPQTPGEPVRFSVQASWAGLKKRENPSPPQ
jgi:Tfp pilus assembly protein PilN